MQTICDSALSAHSIPPVQSPRSCMWMRMVAFRLTFVLLPMLICLVLASCEKKEKFEIKDGTLLRYNGKSAVVELPGEVEVIAVDAFAGCDYVTEVIFPVRLSSIEPGAMADCTNAVWTVAAAHPLFYIDNGNLMRRGDDYLILAARNGAVPAHAAGVADGAYAHLESEVTPTIPPAVTTITAGILQDCRADTIVIPRTVTTIQKGALDGLPVTHLSLPFLGTSVDDDDAVFGDVFGEQGDWFTTHADKRGNRIPNHITHVTLTGGQVHEDAFYNCKKLEQIVIGDGVTGYIQKNAFVGTGSMSHLYIGAGIDGLENNAVTMAGKTWTGYSLYYVGSESEWDSLDKTTGWFTNWYGTSKPKNMYYETPAP